MLPSSRVPGHAGTKLRGSRSGPRGLRAVSTLEAREARRSAATRRACARTPPGGLGDLATQRQSKGVKKARHELSSFVIVHTEVK